MGVFILIFTQKNRGSQRLSHVPKPTQWEVTLHCATGFCLSC